MGRVYGRKLGRIGGSDYGVWDPDGGDVHVLPGAQASQRGTVGRDCARRGRTDAAGAFGGGTLEAFRNSAGGRGAWLYRYFRPDRAPGAGRHDRSDVWRDSPGGGDWLLCGPCPDSSGRESALKLDASKLTNR